MLFPEAQRAVTEARDAQSVTDPAFDHVAERARDRAAALAAPREDVAEFHDVDADGVACRLYLPAERRPGVIVHLHGGGFVLNDIEVHDPAARRLGNRSGVAVLSVDYRRPPEHRFPAAPDDVDTVLGWLDREGPARGLVGPAYAHGDSAGANLALVAALRHPGRFAAVALIYPFLDPSQSFDSYASEAEGFAAGEAAWYWQQYAGSPADLEDPDLAPLRSDRLGTLPPTLVVTAEHDPLRDEGEHLARRLAQEGVTVTATRYLGQVHGFWRHPGVFPSADPLMVQVTGFLGLHR
ncbi:alpha/beta hydrolase [Nocardioides pantholopis]|uniref:alpha/beta hydrolase n=1 Tax=Nocardioides pantholopis TaxID=2483798 RepID=UPI000FDA5343|nr:alpha/beta hydrolase [Nocardioides pantholopis]